MVKAISLISGGLDSTLSTKVVMDQGVEVVAVNFVLPFYERDHKKGSGRDVEAVSRQLGVPLRVVATGEDFLKILQHPKHGFGSNANPCIDCRILMLKKAKGLMEKEGASFLVTGEVLGQRPMSQRLQAMKAIEKEADVVGLVLRPLSAKLLPVTIPEENGWVDRQKLLDISGRMRKTQMKMAQDFNIKDYPCPAGGCLLTNEGFGGRVKDLIKHNVLTVDNMDLLKAGRSFRLTSAARLIVGRDEGNNARLSSMAREGDVLFYPEEDTAGATALGRGDFSSLQILQLAARLTARYFDRNASGVARVVTRFNGKAEILEVTPMTDEEAKRYLI